MQFAYCPLAGALWLSMMLTGCAEQKLSSGIPVALEEANQIEESGKRVNYYTKSDQLISLADGVICCTNGTTQTETEAFVAKLKENGVRTE